MKRIAIVGVGVGGGSLTADGAAAIGGAEVLLGAERLLEPYAGRVCHAAYLPEDVAAYIGGSKAEGFAVLVSGDVGFYSAATKLGGALAEFDVSFVPGISTVNAFFARLRLPWQDAAFVSLHGRKANLIDTVRRNRLTFCLAGRALELPENVKVFVGENLGTKSERVYELGESRAELPPLSVMLIINERFDLSVPSGLPDEAFRRIDGVPMTKAEVRAVVLSKLRLRPDFVCWDIGAGTGSVSVEMALSAYRGHVCAIERKEEAIPNIRRNCSEFCVGNVTAVCGEAPMAFKGLPRPNAVFIGGSGGAAARIIGEVFATNPNARLVMTAVTLEAVPAALEAIQAAGHEPEVVQISVSRGKRVGGSHMMLAQNPVTIISTGGRK